MSKQESDLGFVTLCTILHKNLLTWLVVNKNPQPKEGFVYVRQSELSQNKGYTEVEVLSKDLGNYMVFGGFFLSVIRQNIHGL
jgi:hypothetical protein